MAIVAVIALGLEGFKMYRLAWAYQRRADAWQAVHVRTLREIEERKADVLLYRDASRADRDDADALARWAETMESLLAGLYAEDAQYAHLAASYRDAARAPWRGLSPDPPVSSTIRNYVERMSR